MYFLFPSKPLVIGYNPLAEHGSSVGKVTSLILNEFSVSFVDFWEGHDPHNNILINVL